MAFLSLIMDLHNIIKIAKANTYAHIHRPPTTVTHPNHAVIILYRWIRAVPSVCIVFMYEEMTGGYAVSSPLLVIPFDVIPPSCLNDSIYYYSLSYTNTLPGYHTRS